MFSRMSTRETKSAASLVMSVLSKASTWACEGLISGGDISYYVPQPKKWGVMSPLSPRELPAVYINERLLRGVED